jgi:hypothetical protein
MEYRDRAVWPKTSAGEDGKRNHDVIIGIWEPEYSGPCERC